MTLSYAISFFVKPTYIYSFSYGLYIYFIVYTLSYFLLCLKTTCQICLKVITNDKSITSCTQCQCLTPFNCTPGGDDECYLCHLCSSMLFAIALLEYANGVSSFNKLPISDICFNLFEQYDNNQFSMNCPDIDPDSNYFNTFNDHINFTYMIEQELNHLTNGRNQTL